MTGAQFDFDEVAMLLPFYANGTIGHGDRARVDDALEQSAELRDELAEIIALQSLVQTGGNDWATEQKPASEARLDALMDRIEAESPAPAPQVAPRRTPTPEPKASLMSFITSLFQPAWKPAFAAVAIIALAQGVMLSQANAPVTGGGKFETASGPDSTELGDDDIHLILRFANETSWQDIDQLLTENQLRIIDGPTDGVIEVAAEQQESGDTKSELIKDLKTDQAVESVLEVR